MTTQTYGPPPTTAPLALAPADPLVVPVDPARGWAVADTGRRAAALVALPLALLIALASTDSTAPVPGAGVVFWALLGPATFYSLARVLRPEPRSVERTPRHLLAATATSFAVPVLAAMWTSGDDDVIITLGSPAAALGVVTVVWGVGAFAVRVGLRGR